MNEWLSRCKYGESRAKMDRCRGCLAQLTSSPLQPGHSRLKRRKNLEDGFKRAFGVCFDFGTTPLTHLPTSFAHRAGRRPVPPLSRHSVRRRDSSRTCDGGKGKQEKKRVHSDELRVPGEASRVLVALTASSGTSSVIKPPETENCPAHYERGLPITSI